MKNLKPIVVDQFLGEVNTIPPNKQKLGSLALSSNVQVTNSGSLKKRKGYTLVAQGTAIKSSYGTQDHRFIFLVDNSNLYRLDNGGIRALASGATASAYYWAEESSNKVFMLGAGLCAMIDNGDTVSSLYIPKPVGVSVQNGAGGISAGKVMIAAQYKNSTGLLGPLSDPVSIELSQASILVTVPSLANHTAVVSMYMPLSGAWHIVGETNTFLALNALPASAPTTDELYFDVEAVPLNGVVSTAFYQSRLVAAICESPNLTRIQFSVPYHYHLFHTTDDRFDIPDQVTGMTMVNGELLITGRNGLYVFTSDIRLVRLADYGTPVGKPIERIADGSVRIWTDRGLCRFPEFKNLTEAVVSLPPGTGCASALYEQGGDQYLLVCNDGQGTAYNAN
jgi:hypothetical protein